MSTPRILAFVYAALVPLGLNAGPPALLIVLCAVLLLAVGDLWLRALPGESVGALARVGLASVCGLVTLPAIAITLHVTDQPIRTAGLAAGLAVVVTGLGGVTLLRERIVRPAADPRLLRTIAAVVVPGVLMIGVAGGAVYAYDRLPQPAEPGYTSVALNGWAAHLTAPIGIPARGLVVPIRVSSAGEPSRSEPLRVRVGDRISPPRAVPVSADSTRSVEVRVPAPPNQCLHRIEISLGEASTVFYGFGPKRPGPAGVVTC